MKVTTIDYEVLKKEKVTTVSYLKLSNLNKNQYNFNKSLESSLTPFH